MDTASADAAAAMIRAITFIIRIPCDSSFGTHIHGPSGISGNGRILFHEWRVNAMAAARDAVPEKATGVADKRQIKIMG